MSDWLLKICTEHPLVTYLEDGIRCNDPQGWQQHIQAFSEKGIKIGVNSWFQSSMDTVKHHTQIVEVEEPEPVSEVEEEQEEPAEKDEMGKTTSALSNGEPKEPEEPVDPNADKVIPSSVHMNRVFDKEMP